MTWDELLKSAAESGETLDLSSEAWKPRDALTGDHIARALLDETVAPSREGLKIRGARIHGELRLDYTKLPYPLKIVQSHFDSQPSFVGTTLTELDLSGSVMPGITLDEAKISGNLTLSAVRSTRPILARHIAIAGDLSMAGATIGEEGTTPKVWHPDRMSTGRGIVVDMKNAEVAGATIFRKLIALGVVHLFGATLSELILSDAIIRNPNAVAINMNLVNVAGNVISQRMQIWGELLSHNSTISGNFLMNDAVLQNPNRSAIALFGARIMGETNFAGATIYGAVNAIGLNTRFLHWDFLRVHHVSSNAVNLDHARIAGDVNMRFITVWGCLALYKAQVGGNMHMNDSYLSHQAGFALACGGIEVGANIFMSGLKVSGCIDLHSASVGRDLDLSGVDVHKHKGWALNMTRIRVGENLIVVMAQISGKVGADGAIIGKDFLVQDSTFTSAEEIAIGLDAASINRLILNEVDILKGFLTLERAAIGHLEVWSSRGRTPPLWSALGWRLGTVDGPLFADRKATRKWLRTISRSDGFTAEPWKELARVYQRMGQHEDARSLRFRAARLTTRTQLGWSWVARVPYEWVVGYGYYPLAVIPWLVTLWALAFGLAASNSAQFTPTDPRAMSISQEVDGRAVVLQVNGASEKRLEGYPKFSPELYALDTAMPSVATGQSTSWRVADNQWLAGGLAAIKCAAWILSALLLAGIAGILRKD